MVPSVCLSDLSVRNKAFSSQNISVLPHVDLQEYDETLPPPLSFLLQKFRRRVQESTQVLRELEISLRTNHIGWVTAESAQGCVALHVRDLPILDLRGKVWHSRHQETQTLTLTTTIPHSYLCSDLILHRKPCGDEEKMNQLIVPGSWHMNSVWRGNTFLLQ